MNKLLLLLLTALLSLQCVAQVTYVIDGFSDEYYGKLYISDISEVFSEGWVAVYSKKNSKELIKIESDELAFTLHNGEVKANIAEAPYGEQSVLIYDDFNFDGEKDFAIMTGQYSCYHGPSFDIYLFDKGGFTYSESFSELSTMYCGMFQYDSTEKRIYTMTKSGCCWHQYNEYTVEDNEPMLIHSVEEGMTASGAFFDITESTWDGTEMQTEGKWILNTEVLENDYTPYYSFSIENGEKIILFHEIENNIRFLRVDSKYEVLDSYPYSYDFESTDFMFHESEKDPTCTFSDLEADSCYIIYLKGKKTGITIEKEGKILKLKGDPSSLEGNLSDVMNAENVTIEKN